LGTLKAREGGVRGVQLRTRVLCLVVRPLISQLRLQHDFFGVQTMTHQGRYREQRRNHGHRYADLPLTPLVCLSFVDFLTQLQ